MSELSPYLASVATTIDHMIDRYFVDKTGELNKASAHLLAAGGKRLRPALAILAGGATGGICSSHLDLAVVLELIH